MSDSNLPNFPDLSALFEQAQKMQQEFAHSQEELARKTVEASAGGGMVLARFSGTKELLALHIEPQVIDPKEPGMLEDLVIAAINQGLQKVKVLEEEMMQQAAKGFNLPIP